MMFASRLHAPDSQSALSKSRLSPGSVWPLGRLGLGAGKRVGRSEVGGHGSFSYTSCQHQSHPCPATAASSPALKPAPNAPVCQLHADLQT